MCKYTSLCKKLNLRLLFCNYHGVLYYHLVFIICVECIIEFVILKCLLPQYLNPQCLTNFIMSSLWRLDLTSHYIDKSEVTINEYMLRECV